MDRKWMIITCFFSIVTFISSIICSSLIFYNEKNRTEINSEKVLAANKVYKNSTVIYNENNSIDFSNVSSGYTVTRDFSITNNNSNPIKYSVMWSNIVSTFNSEKLTYSLSCSNGEKITNRQIPTKENEYDILKEAELKTNSTNNCTITINYADSDEFVEEQNQSFGGKYQVKIIE
jgi:hypothetical protein